MAEIPKAEVQNTQQVLRDMKEALAAVGKEVVAARAIQAQVASLLRQCAFYERGVQSARGRIVLLLLAQLRHAEAARVEGYSAKVDEALAELAERTKAEAEAGAEGGAKGKK
jgi:hypothetical protein